MTPESPLDALRRLDREATAAPWSLSIQGPIAPNGGYRAIIEHAQPSDGQPYVASTSWETSDDEPWTDAALIVTLRNTLPALLRLVDAAEQLDEELDFVPLFAALAELTTPAPAEEQL